MRNKAFSSGRPQRCLLASAITLTLASASGSVLAAEQPAAALQLDSSRVEGKREGQGSEQNYKYGLPLNLAIGDRMYWLSTGAYTTSYSAVEFNGFPPLKSFFL